MFNKIILITFFLFISKLSHSAGYDVFGFGIYDIKLDGSETDHATDFRYERRFDHTLIKIGPEADNFFYLKPFAGIEITIRFSCVLSSRYLFRG